MDAATKASVTACVIAGVVGVVTPMTVWINKEDTPALFGAKGADARRQCPEGTAPFKPRGESAFATCVDAKIATYIYCVDNILYSTSTYHDGRTYTFNGGVDASAQTHSYDEQGTTSNTDKGIEARAVLALQCGRFVPSDDEFINAMLEPVSVRVAKLKEILRKGSLRKGGVWQWAFPEGHWLVHAKFVDDAKSCVGSPPDIRDAGPTNSKQSDVEDAGADATIGHMCMHADMWYCDANVVSEDCGSRPRDLQWSGRSSVDANGNIVIESGYLHVHNNRGHNGIGDGYFRMDLKMRPGPVVTGTWFGFGRSDAGQETWSGKETPGNVFMYAP